MKAKKKRDLLVKIFGYGVFWSWNLIFAIFFGFVVIPYLLVDIIRDTFTGLVPWNFTLFSILIPLIPVLSIFLGFSKFKKDPKKLLQLFYGIEVPLCFIFLLRLWLFRELNPGTTHLLIILCLGAASFLFELFRGFKLKTIYKDTIQFVGHILLLISGVYVGIVLLFYAIPFISFILIEFLKFEWFFGFMDLLRLIFSISPYYIFIAIVSLLFITYTATVLLGLPIALPIIYLKSYIRKLRHFSVRYGKNLAYSISIIIIILNIAIFTIANIQPQKKVFDLLKNDSLTNEQKKKLLTKKNFIRRGLLNAYLSPYRYISSDTRNTHIARLYQNVFNLSKPANAVGAAYNLFVRPFLYNGNAMHIDKNKAGKYYENFFDEPIQKAEREAIKHAIKSTWDRDGVEAGLLNVDDKNVLITQQSINITEHGDWAEVEIYERYRNKTRNLQEILYYFSLPENAVLTGLWLSDDPISHKKYSYNISPRGAAQQVYVNQVRRRFDPSLLEQVGPRQYRLRAFPVQFTRLNEIFIKDHMQIWFSYKCFVDKNNEWPMPVLSEKRNVYWSKKTSFSINGKESGKTKKDDWFPESIPAGGDFEIKGHFAFINDSIIIKSTPYIGKEANNFDGKFALMIDPSYSMNKVKKNLRQSLEWIKTHKIEADIYWMNNNNIESSSIDKFNSEKLIFFGKCDVLDLIEYYPPKSIRENYSAVILLTDEGSYELSSDNNRSLSFPCPIHIVHLNKKLPRAYDDELLETITQSGGDIHTSIDEVFDKIRNNKSEFENEKIISINSNLKWEIDTFAVSEKIKYKETGFEALAAGIFINNLAKQSTIINSARMDLFHSVAKKYSIVTPYSSMIVLVNDRQLDELRNAELRNDRFEREVEKGNEAISRPFNPFTVTGTPEPEEWILISIVILLLSYYFIKKRKKNLILSFSRSSNKSR